MPVKLGRLPKVIAEDLSRSKGKCYEPFMDQYLTQKHSHTKEEVTKM
jgi:hypothetical protein